MLTYTEQKNLAIEISGLSDVGAVNNFKRDIQAGTARFLAKLSRPIDRVSRFTNQVANQQYYQMPEDAIRVSKVKAQYGSATNYFTSLQEIGDEDAWIAMNATVQTGIPAYYFIRGADEVGLYPIPSTTITNGIELVFEPRHVLMTADDYTAGTVAIINGGAVVTGTGTTFTPIMANGSYVLQTTDGSDGNYYRITGYTSATVITLENFYQGTTASAAAYRIGQVSKIPEEYQEAPVDYAMFRHYLAMGEMEQAKMFMGLWQSSLKDAEDVYGMTTSNQIIMANNSASRAFDPLRDVTANQIKV